MVSLVDYRGQKSDQVRRDMLIRVGQMIKFIQYQIAIISDNLCQLFYNIIKLKMQRRNEKQNQASKEKEREKRARSGQKTSRTNASLQALKEIINDVSNSQRASVKEIKLEEGIVFLNKKIQKQSTQIIGLSEELKKMGNLNRQVQEKYETQREKNRKNTNAVFNSHKSIGQIRKKLAAAESKISQGNKKIEEGEHKIIRYKDMVRKKQNIIEQLQYRIQNKQHYEDIINNQKQQIKQLRERYYKMKGKDDDLQSENIQLKQKLQRVKESNNTFKQQLSALKHKHNISIKQYKQLSEKHTEQVNVNSQMQEQYEEILKDKNAQIQDLKYKTQQIRQLQNYSKDRSVYGQQVCRILKQHISNKNTKNKIQKEILQLIQEMENRWQNILIRALAIQS